MATREDAISLAKRDTRAALASARDIDEPWYRCQALAWIARFAPDDEFIQIADEALRTAAGAVDRYQRVGAAAWPIRALIERSEIGKAGEATAAVIRLASEIEYAGSRAEALYLLIEATLLGPPTLWNPVLKALLDMPYPPIHWRHRRALRNSFLMLSVVDPEFDKDCLVQIKDEKTRCQILDRMAGSTRRSPRAFFW